MKKNIIFLILILVLVGIFTFYFNQKKSNNNEKIIKVGVSQIISHVGIDDVRRGIIIGFANNGYREGDNIIFDFQNAQGEASINQAIAQKFANSDYDLLIPIGTQSSQAIKNLVQDKPIVFAAVTDPISAGLLNSKELPGGNITGTSDMILFKQQLELLKKLKPETKKVGLVYNPSESNSRFGMDETKKYGKELGFEFVTAPANNTGEVLTAARSIASKVDAFYILSDNTVVAGQDALIKVAIEEKKPLIAVEQSGVEKGAIATIGINYVKLGEKTAELAIRVINGEKPGSIPVLGIEDGDLFINTKTAALIGINIPEDLIKEAKQIYK